ncbi:hypothetical protein B0H94_102204 [Salsuginibacillus halophilus]|uniref:Uncharacterized protein n=1 Tax=Salsuginibacillus halophilus TaxID=517424 RepID=A0A2P8HXJ6_9BACI|nr:hypothetical protein B0H94_102204 [Salsuginibacillus halophilus]
MRLFSLFVGFGLAVSGGISVLAYMNYMAAGYPLHTYLIFISGRIELYMFLCGWLLIILSMLPYKFSSRRN